VDPIVTLDQVPRWSDVDPTIPYISDPLTAGSDGGLGAAAASRFPVDPEINSRIYLWRGNPWNLEVDAVVNSTNEVRLLQDPNAYSSPFSMK
jgi:hypothetical protein